MNLDPYRNETPPRREVLPGGAVLLSVPMRTAHGVTLGVWLRTGSQDEPSGLGGVSHFLEHIVFKGTKNRSALEVAETFDRMGAAVDAFTTKDLVAFTIKILPEFFAEAVALLGEMLLEPQLDSRLLHLEQDVVCEEIQEALDTPEDRLHDSFAGQLYGSNGRGRPILGSPGVVRTFGAELMREQHQRLLAPANIVISMAGNIMDGFHETVAETFAMPGWTGPAGPGFAHDAAAPPAAAFIDLDLDEADPFRLELTSPIIQTYFEIGNLGIPFHHDDRVPVFLLTNMLGGGMSSRIFQAVREKEGLAYTVYNYSDMGRDIGLVSCAGSCSPDKLERLEDVIRMEYYRLISEGVKTAELDSNRAQIKSQLIFSLEGMVNQMYRSARNEILYGRFLPVSELVDDIDGIVVDDIVRCAESYFNPDSLLVATHGPVDTRDG
ncbi:MAG: pitrilysin family protein [Candidatus Krumholzibacteriota bacterium]